MVNPGNSQELLIVHGKNLGVGSSAEDIRRDRFSLSRESRFNALAAGQLWHPGQDILFSSGVTVPGLPSEAAAMRHYMDMIGDLHQEARVPDDNILLQETSIDTASDAQEIAKILAGRKYGRVILLSTGYHVANAAFLCEQYGVRIDNTVASEDIIRGRSAMHARLVERWRASGRIKKEYKKELVRSVLLHTIDPKGKLIKQITQRTRG